MRNALAQFETVYRNEMVPWMSQAKVETNGLGPAARKALQSFSTLEAILTDVVQLKQSYNTIMNGTAIGELQKRTREMDEAHIAAIREDIAVLERAVAREKEIHGSI